MCCHHISHDSLETRVTGSVTLTPCSRSDSLEAEPGKGMRVCDLLGTRSSGKSCESLREIDEGGERQARIGFQGKSSLHLTQRCSGAPTTPQHRRWLESQEQLWVGGAEWNHWPAKFTAAGLWVPQQRGYGLAPLCPPGHLGPLWGLNEVTVVDPQDPPRNSSFSFF